MGQRARASWIGAVVVSLLVACGGKLSTEGTVTRSCSTGAACGPGLSISVCTSEDPLGACQGVSYEVSGRSFACASCQNCVQALLDARRACDGGGGGGMSSGGGTSGGSGSSGGGTSSGGTSGSSGTVASCAPETVVGFSPRWIPPAAHQGACTQQSIDLFLQSCLGPTSDQVACNSYLGTVVGKTCSGCIITPSSASSYGPLVEDTLSGLLHLNVAGCVALASADSSATGCAARVQASQQCGDVACKGCAPVSDPGTHDALVACERQAEHGVCASSAQAATCMSVSQSAQVARCAAMPSGDFLASAGALAQLFCLKP
jgi:hypothetical protein